MNTLPKLLALSSLILGSLLGGCAPTTGAPLAKNGNPSARNCSSTLKEHCAEHGCGTYDQAVSRTQALKTNPPTAYPWAFSVGTCGSLRFVTIQEGMGVGTEYFDPSGALVATTGLADAEVCRGEFSWNAGGRPSCTEQTLEHAGGSPP